MIKASIIIPCYNEQSTIRQLLDALVGQTIPHEEIEIIIADGMSADHTRKEILGFQRDHPQMRIIIVDNPERNIPSGLNRAIENASGKYLVRLDAHSIPYPDYIERCLADLGAGKGDNVGGVWEIKPFRPTWIARGIAAAASHPLGVGDASYRISAQAGEVDTVPFGAYSKELIQRIGAYNEKLLTNEDYEFNARIRKSGGKVWLDPLIRSVYFARGNLVSLAQQYLRYGFWKGRMIRNYPETLRWRQALPPVFVLSLLLLGIIGVFFRPAWWLLGMEVTAYLIILILFGIQKGVQSREPGLIIGMPLAIATMHLCWGAAFLWSLCKKV